MSDDMLHAVLNLPLSAWQDTPIGRCQRHARYVQASQVIRQQAAEIERLEQLVAWLGKQE